MKLKFSMLTLGLVCCASFTAQASLIPSLFASLVLAPSDSLEVIQISGTRLNDLPVGASSVVSREQIEQLNPASTIDLLKRLPHVDVAENGNTGGFSYLSIRGGEFNFTLVTIDGIAVNDSTNSRGGGFDFNQINPAAIERIEVYRGGINSIYGGDAISGVINIVTRDNTAPVMTLEAGSNQQVNASLTGSFSPSEQTNVLASLSTQNKRVSSFEELNAHQLLIKGQYQENALTLGSLFTFNETEAKGFTEDSGGELFANPAVAEEHDSNQYIVGLSAAYQALQNTKINGQLSWLHREETIVNPGIEEGVFSGIPASDITSDYERLELDVFASFAMDESTSFVAGINQRQQDGSNRGFLDFGFALPVDYDFSQDISSLYLEGQHIFNSLTIEASARYDAPDDFDNETSFRLGASYAIKQGSRVFAVFNQGYKLPSFFALAHPLVGNSELQPERSDNFEVGFSTQVSDSIEYGITYFANKFDDLVDFDAELFTNVNRNNVDISGLEFDVSAGLSQQVNLLVNMRYLDIDAPAGVTLRKRPNVAGNVRLEFTYKQSRNSVFVDFRDNYLDSSIATGFVQSGGYASIGASSIVSLTPQLDLSLNLENILSKRFQDSVGFIEDQIEARAGMSYRF